MSLTEIKTERCPNWSHIAEYISFSKLLGKIANLSTTYVTCYAYEDMAYIVVRDKTGDTKYFKIKSIIWKNVVHMITINPANCNCWCCQWRNKYGKYLHPMMDFRHIRNSDLVPLSHATASTLELARNAIGY